MTQELIDLLMSWNHHSGFNVHGKQKINGANGHRIEKIARDMSRAAIDPNDYYEDYMPPDEAYFADEQWVS